MATTVDPLTHEEKDALLKAAARFESRTDHHPDQFREFRAAEVIAFGIGTGMHPEVWWEPVEHALRLEVNRGVLYAKWNRTKKAGIRAACSAKLGAADDPDVAWVRPFVERVIALRRTRKYWYWFIRTVWETTGLPGICSPRTLRHTSGADVAEETGDPFAVAAHLNVSLEVGWQYVRGAGARRAATSPSILPRIGGPT
jgi:integrase